MQRGLDKDTVSDVGHEGRAGDSSVPELIVVVNDRVDLRAI
mgnify:CR=1 FL=1